jgi:hypothetical protein
MIDPHWSVIDLDPRTWRAVGGYFDPGQYIRAAQPGEHGLFVLHDGGRVLRVVDTTQGVRRDLALSRVDDPHELAHKLFNTNEWERVHVIDKRHLAAVASKAQENPRRELTLDQYYRLVYSLVWDSSDGYVTVPARPGAWRGWTYGDLQGFAAMLPDPSTVALVVIEGGETSIGLVLDLRERLIRTVTTLETFGFPAPLFAVTQSDFERLWSMLEARAESSGSPQPAALLLCSRPVFDKLVHEPDKQDVLRRASEQGEAFWRMRLGANG